MYKAFNLATGDCEVCSNNWEYVKQFVDGYAGLIRFYVESNGCGIYYNY